MSRWRAQKATLVDASHHMRVMPPKCPPRHTEPCAHHTEPCARRRVRTRHERAEAREGGGVRRRRDGGNGAPPEVARGEHHARLVARHALHVVRPALPPKTGRARCRGACQNTAAHDVDHARNTLHAYARMNTRRGANARGGGGSARGSGDVRAGGHAHALLSSVRFVLWCPPDGTKSPQRHACAAQRTSGGTASPPSRPSPRPRWRAAPAWAARGASARTHTTRHDDACVGLARLIVAQKLRDVLRVGREAVVGERARHQAEAGGLCVQRGHDARVRMPLRRRVARFVGTRKGSRARKAKRAPG